MRRSAYVFAPILASAAVALSTGCHHAEPQRCVDETNHVVDPKFCSNLPPGAQQPVVGNSTNGGGYYGGGGIFYPHMYRYYYGGGGGYGLGSIVNGGAYAPAPATAMATSAAAARRSPAPHAAALAVPSPPAAATAAEAANNMQRHNLTPRPNWQQTVEQQGLTYHTPDTLPPGSRPYWDESACYEFTAAEIDRLEAAGNELQTMCLAAAQNVIDNQRYAELEIPAEAVPLIEWAWNEEPPALYGRFDLLYNGGGPPKLLEYNADTPTSLLEAAVIQWYWLKDVYPDADQFNSLHEKLIAKWKDVSGYLSKPVYFASADYPEDLLTVAYLRDTAEQAGLNTVQLLMQDIGWNEPRQCFVDPDPQERTIKSIFKLYPWETMLEEEFATAALRTYKDMRWIEPIWKMLLSNKGILPILWELYPNHELLLESKVIGPNDGWTPAPGWVRKPMHSREGSNIVMVGLDGEKLETPGPYDNRMTIDQRLGPATIFPDGGNPGRWPVVGLWMIDQECCGLGIRESAGPITDNLSSFVPHFFR